MSELQRTKLNKVIDSLSKVISISEEQKSKLIEQYSDFSEQEIIKDLASKVYLLIGPDSSYYEYALELIRNYNPSVCPNIDAMKKMLSDMFENKVEGNMPLEENHKLVNESLMNFCKLFNEFGIDYYIVGALPCFIKTGQPLFRYHDDIDIMVNEEDIPKIADILKHTNYEFQDDRFPTLNRFLEMQKNEPPHTVLAQNKDNEFHLGFFCFRREQDNTITVREYSHRLDGEQVAVDVLERSYDPIGTSLRYDDTPTNYNGVSFRTGSVENVYKLKGYTRRPKDLTDMKKLEPFIDKQKLDALGQYESKTVVHENVEKSLTSDEKTNGSK